jgi:hypothetical protein
VKITDTEMTSDLTPHTARFDPDAAAVGSGAWIVSWLPQRLLTRNQAITAMTLAEAVAAHPASPGSQWWPFIQGWAAELGVATQRAIDLSAVPA